MLSRLVAWLCLACLVLTALWVGLLIADMASAGPLETLDHVVAHAAQLHGLFYATYLNAALLTLAAVALFAALYVWLKSTVPGWAVIGLVFVPIYGAFNLTAYLMQVTLVPELLTLRLDPRYAAAANVLLRLTLLSWSGSATAFFNGLAYAILGIPSIVYGLLLRRGGGALAWGGLLLAFNGAACILGVVGFLIGSTLLAQGVVIGGILFLAAMFPLAWGFWYAGPGVISAYS